MESGHALQCPKFDVQRTTTNLKKLLQKDFQHFYSLPIKQWSQMNRQQSETENSYFRITER